MDTQCKGHSSKTGDSSSSIAGLYRLETEHRNVHSGSTYCHIQQKPGSNCGLQTSLTDDFHSLFAVPPPNVITAPAIRPKPLTATCF